MLFDKQDLLKALTGIGNNYRKILLINITKDTCQPVTIPDDELKILKDKIIFSLKAYWKWFCSSEFLHPDDKKSCLEFVAGPNAHIVYRRLMEDGYHWVICEIIPAQDYSKDNESCVLYVRDINNIYVPEYENVVEKIGTTDSFTGLLNKVAFTRDAEKNKDKHVGVLFADLNGLKWTNDNLGHKAGDELILKFAGLLTVNFGNCKCYHISGDEFVVCCWGGSLHEFIKKAITFHKSLWWASEYPIASVGYSVGEASEFQKAYEEAEKEMYDDKRIFYQRFPQYKRK